MRVAIASDGFNAHHVATSTHYYARGILEAACRVGVEAFELPIPCMCGAKVGGRVVPFLRRVFGRYPVHDGALVHHPSEDALRGVDVVTLQDLHQFYDRRLTDRIRAMATRAAVRRAKRIVVTTEWSRRELAARFPEQAAKVRVIPVPFRAPERAERASTPDYDALWVGRNAPNKNLPLYLGLASRFPGLRFAVRASRAAGREALDLEVERALASLPNTTRLPQLREDALDALYRSVPLLVVTSPYEGFHMPAMEAYARGAKLVLPRIEPLAETYGTAVNVFWYEPAWVMRPLAWDFSRSLAALAAAFREARETRVREPEANVLERVSLATVGRQLKAVYEELLPS